MKCMMMTSLVLACSIAPTLAFAQSRPAPGPSGNEGVLVTAQSASQRIEGLWDEQVTQVDCKSGAPLHPIGRGTNLFIRGGALVATNNAPPTVMGITFGEWRHAGGNRFRVRMRLNLFQPPLETFVGVREITREITLSDHGNSLSGAVSVQDYFPEGAPNGSPFCASETGTRIASP